MASETVYRCDVCGREIPHSHDRLEIRLDGCSAERRAKLKIGGLYDMCEDCVVRFAHMFNAYKADDIYTAIEQMLSARSELADKIRAIGYTGKEGRIYIGGRLFAVRELPQ